MYYYYVIDLKKTHTVIMGWLIMVIALVAEESEGNEG